MISTVPLVHQELLLSEETGPLRPDFDEWSDEVLRRVEGYGNLGSTYLGRHSRFVVFNYKSIPIA